MKRNSLRLPNHPSLRFSPTAWAKLVFLRDAGDTEVGGFGIALADDLLFVDDVQLVGQNCTPVSVKFDDESVADFFDRQVDSGLKPQQFARIWVHTHPGTCPEPSITDEETFARVFDRTEWAVMFILAEGGQSYARLCFHVGPGGSIALPVSIDYARPFGASDHDTWTKEYGDNVRVTRSALFAERGIPFEPSEWDGIEEGEVEAWLGDWDEYVSEEPTDALHGDPIDA